MNSDDAVLRDWYYKYYRTRKRRMRRKRIMIGFVAGLALAGLILIRCYAT